jgi:DNA topoisomerase-1
MLGAHPETGAEVKVLNGRFGAYVSDGTTNANVPKAKDPKALTLEEAVTLLAERAAKGPSAKRGRKAPAKKAAPKKPAAKKAATKKPAARKAGA